MILIPLLFLVLLRLCNHRSTTNTVTAFSYHSIIVYRKPWTDHCTTTGSTVTFKPILVDGRKTSSLLQSSASTSSSSSYENRMLARKYIQQGMVSFRLGNIPKSIELFNLAEQIDISIVPYLWQRGISYYYNQQYKQASDQFRIDVQVNPYDVEEIVWDIASQVQYNKQQQHDVVSNTKLIFPIPNQLSLPPGANDRRRIMGYVYKLFRGEGTEQDLARAGLTNNASLSDEFYALFYLALYNEIRNESTDMARLYLTQALNTKYTKQYGDTDYMVACAQVHAKIRNWR